MQTVSDIIADSNLEARDYQIRVINKAIDGFADGLASQLINAPTGSGKTAMALIVAKSLQQRYGCGVSWCAMRRNLLAQAAAANVDSGVEIDSLMPTSMFDNNPPTHDENGRKIDVLVFDEAHHSVASSAISIIDKVRPRFVLGLSGTPFRTDKIKLCFQRTLRDAGIRQLVEAGYLSKYHKFVIPEWTPETVAKRYLAEPERWGKSAFYWRTEEDARACQKLLLAGGCRVGIVLGTQSEAEREETLDMFESGTGLDAIVNLFILTEGWDMPALQTVWVRDSSRGPTTQMAGRVFRKHASLPHKQIVQSEHTKYPVEKIVGPEHGYVWTEGSWRSIKADDSVNRVSVVSMMMIAHTNTTMPEYITKRKEKRRRRRNQEPGVA